MISISSPSYYPKKSQWSPENSQTIIENVACILPPDLDEDELHNFLLRFQFEEVQYKLNHLTDETAISQKFETFNKRECDPKLQQAPMIKLKDRLLVERQNILDSIQKIYPPFIDNYDNDYRIKCEFTSTPKVIKQVEFDSLDKIELIFGTNGKRAREIEKIFNVQLKFQSEAPESHLSQSNLIRKEFGHFTIKGNNHDQVMECYHFILEIMKSGSSYQYSKVLKKKKSGNISYSGFPWSLQHSQINNINSNNDEENDELEKYNLPELSAYLIDANYSDFVHEEDEEINEKDYFGLVENCQPPGVD